MTTPQPLTRMFFRLLATTALVSIDAAIPRIDKRWACRYCKSAMFGVGFLLYCQHCDYTENVGAYI